MRENGIQDGQAAYDRFATSLANQKAARAGDPGFCQTIDTFVRMATEATQADLLVLAASVSDAPATGACPPSNYVADATPVGPKEITAPEPPADVPAEATAAAEPEEVTAAAEPADEAKTSATAAAAAPVEEKAAEQQATTTQTDTAAPATNNATRDDALKAAIVALQSATAALQAATTSSGATETAAAKKPQSDLVNVADAPVVPPKEEAEE